MSRRIWFTAAIVAGLLVLAGCGPRPEYVFTDQEGARSYLLVRLAEKYGVEFQVLHATFNDDGYSYAGTIAAADDEGKWANARVTRTGTLEDSWAVWLFEDELIAQPMEVCTDFAVDLLSCRAQPRMRTTSQVFDPAMPVDEFLADAKVTVWVTLEFVSTDEDVVAPMIQAMIDHLDQGPTWYALDVMQDGWGVYHHLSSEPRPSLDEIKETFP